MKSKNPKKLPDEAKEQLLHAIKAATVMEKNAATEHVTQTAGNIFENNNEPIAVAEFRLNEAQQALDKLDAEIAELERELKKLPPTTTNVST